MFETIITLYVAKVNSFLKNIYDFMYYFLFYNN